MSNWSYKTVQDIETLENVATTETPITQNCLNGTKSMAIDPGTGIPTDKHTYGASQPNPISQHTLGSKYADRQPSHGCLTIDRNKIPITSIKNYVP